jgi:hypothetical protein
MSINHLVNPIQEPKYDVYVRDVEAEYLVTTNGAVVTGNLEVDGNIFTTGEGIISCNLLATDKYVNYQNEYSDNPFTSNDYIFNSFLYLNGWNSLTDVKTFIEVGASRTSSEPYIETYSIRIDGNIDPLAPSVFEFRSREGFEELLDIKCQVANTDGVGDGVFSSVGSLVLPPDDVSNDFQFRVAPISNFSSPIVPPASSNASLTITIKVLIDPI